MADSLSPLEELEAARADLAQQIQRRDNYDGNNPNKYATDVRLAQERVSELERALKASEQLPRTPQEVLDARLDAAFPRARHRDIMTFENERYQRWVTPATRTLSGKVASWNKVWRKHSAAGFVGGD
jgi:hypothetical protein